MDSLLASSIIIIIWIASVCPISGNAKRTQVLCLSVCLCDCLCVCLRVRTTRPASKILNGWEWIENDKVHIESLFLWVLSFKLNWSALSSENYLFLLFSCINIVHWQRERDRERKKRFMFVKLCVLISFSFHRKSHLVLFIDALLCSRLNAPNNVTLKFYWNCCVCSNVSSRANVFIVFSGAGFDSTQFSIFVVEMHDIPQALNSVIDTHTAHILAWNSLYGAVWTVHCRFNDTNKLLQTLHIDFSVVRAWQAFEKLL